jgi:hypothetical protein
VAAAYSNDVYLDVNLQKRDHDKAGGGVYKSSAWGGIIETLSGGGPADIASHTGKQIQVALTSASTT